MYRGSFCTYKCIYASLNFISLDFYICFNLIPYYIMVIYLAVVGTIRPYIIYNMLVIWILHIHYVSIKQYTNLFV